MTEEMSKLFFHKWSYLSEYVFNLQGASKSTFVFLNDPFYTWRTDHKWGNHLKHLEGLSFWYTVICLEFITYSRNSDIWVGISFDFPECIEKSSFERNFIAAKNSLFTFTIDIKKALAV